MNVDEPIDLRPDRVDSEIWQEIKERIDLLPAELTEEAKTKYEAFKEAVQKGEEKQIQDPQLTIIVAVRLMVAMNRVRTGKAKRLFTDVAAHVAPWIRELTD